MSIFGRSQSVETDLNAPVFEGYHEEVNGDILAIQESFDDQLAIIEALHAIDMEELEMRKEVKALRENGADRYEIDARVEQFETVTEAAVKNAWQKIKDYFKKLWGKIKAFFGSVVRTFDGVFMSGQKFVKKYEADLKKLKLNGFKYKYHNYTNLERYDGVTKEGVQKQINVLLDDAVKMANESRPTEDDIKAFRAALEQLRDDKEDVLNAVRGKEIGKSSITSEDFQRELYGYFRDGADDRKDVSERAVDINKVIEVLKDTKAKTIAEKSIKTIDGEFSKIIKTINQLESKLANAKEKNGTYTATQGNTELKVAVNVTPAVLEGLRFYSSMFSAMKDIQLQTFRAWKDAYNERNRVYKSICVAAFRYKEEK